MSESTGFTTTYTVVCCYYLQEINGLSVIDKHTSPCDGSFAISKIANIVSLSGMFSKAAYMF